MMMYDARTYGSVSYEPVPAPQHTRTASQPFVPTPQAYPWTTAQVIPTPQTAVPPTLRGKRFSQRRLIAIAASSAVVVILALLLLIPHGGSQPYTSRDVVNALYQRGLPVTTAYAYSSQNAPDGILTNGSGCTSATAWTDARLTHEQAGLMGGGILEVYETAEQAQTRASVLTARPVTEAGYCFVKGRTVMRVSPSLSNADAQVYGSTLLGMIK